jgi:hypothetical protein
MVSYTDPFAPTIENPVGLDREIQRLQLLLLAQVPWLQLSYGKAYRGSRKQAGSGKLLYYPEVYAGGREYRDVLPNDNVQAQSFFYPTGPVVNAAREPIANTLGLTQAVDLICWANLERVHKGATHRIEHELLLDACSMRMARCACCACSPPTKKSSGASRSNSLMPKRRCASPSLASGCSWS